MKNFTLLFLLIFLSILTYGQESNDRLNGLDKEIQDILEHYNAVGLSVAIVENGQTIYTKGYGCRDTLQKLPVTPNTVFPMGSITKSFTSSLIGMLMDDGKVSLKDKPSLYLPEFQFSSDKMNTVVSVEDLLTHRSGLGGVDGSFVLFPAENNMQLMKRVRYLKPNGEPKDSWLYSNFGYIILGTIIEQQFHSSWGKTVKEKLFVPLEMTNTSTSIEDMVKAGDHAKGYGLSNHEVKEVLFQKFNNDKAVGAINSSANDMANWIKMWLNKGKFHERQILSEKYVTEATSLKAIIDGAPPDSANTGSFIFGYGYGWNVDAYKGHYRVRHGGGVSGFSSNLVMFPKEKIGIIVLTNQHNTDLPYTISYMISDRMLELSKSKPYPYSMEIHDINTVSKHIKPYNESKKTTHDLSNYCGEYVNPGYGKLKIIKENNQLFAVFPGYKFQLEHQYYDVFECKLIYDIPQQMNPEFTLNFLSDNDGNIASLNIGFQRGGVNFRK